MHCKLEHFDTRSMGRLIQSSFFIVVDVNGLKASAIAELRKRLLKAGADLHIVKNSIFRTAAKESGFRQVPFGSQPAVVTGRVDICAAAKVIKTFQSEFEKPTIQFANLGQKHLEKAQVMALVDVPSLEVMRACLLATLQFPSLNLVTLLQTRNSTLTKKQYWCLELRNLWRRIDRGDLQMRTTAAILHGIVERSDESSIRDANTWLTSVHAKIESQSCPSGAALEVEARTLNCGLNVFDPERDPVDVLAFFGAVRSIEEGKADITFYLRESLQRPDAPVMEGFVVPVVSLPLAYSKAGAWVAWVERHYRYGDGIVKKGRFEPASCLI